MGPTNRSIGGGTNGFVPLDKEVLVTIESYNDILKTA